MGACGSKPATSEEKQEICKVCAKSMMGLCASEALSDPSKIVIEVHPSMATIKETSANLKKASEEWADRAGDPAEAEAEAEEGESGGGGMLGRMFGQAKKMGQELLGAVEDITVEGFSKFLETSAKALDAAIAKVEEPQTKVGQEIVEQKKGDILKSINEVIAKSQVPGAEAVCMGTDTDAISKLLIEQSSVDIVDNLKTIVGPAVDAHRGMKAWDELVSLYNKMCDKMVQAKDKLEMQFADDWMPNKVEGVDFKAYICTESVSQLGQLMGTAEAGIRAAPANRDVQHPDIFEKVFKNPKTEKDELLEKEYKAVTKAQKK